MEEDKKTLRRLNEDMVREIKQDQKEAGKWAGELPNAGIERLEAIKQAAGEMLERTNTRTELLSKVIGTRTEDNHSILERLKEWSFDWLMGGMMGGEICMDVPTGAIEMRAARKLLNTLRQLLSTDKELSVRLCSLLKDIDKLINQKLEENEQKKNLRLEAEKKEKEEERKELEHAKSICSCT